MNMDMDSGIVAGAASCSAEVPHRFAPFVQVNGLQSGIDLRKGIPEHACRPGWSERLPNDTLLSTPHTGAWTALELADT